MILKDVQCTLQPLSTKHCCYSMKLEKVVLCTQKEFCPKQLDIEITIDEEGVKNAKALF